MALHRLFDTYFWKLASEANCRSIQSSNFIFATRELHNSPFPSCVDCIIPKRWRNCILMDIARERKGQICVYMCLGLNQKNQIFQSDFSFGPSALWQTLAAWKSNLAFVKHCCRCCCCCSWKLHANRSPLQQRMRELAYSSSYVLCHDGNWNILDIFSTLDAAFVSHIIWGTLGFCFTNVKLLHNFNRIICRGWDCQSEDFKRFRISNIFQRVSGNRVIALCCFHVNHTLSQFTRVHFSSAY